jgi:hypothetical protein
MCGWKFQVVAASEVYLPTRRRFEFPNTHDDSTTFQINVILAVVYVGADSSVPSRLALFDGRLNSNGPIYPISTGTLLLK